MPDQTLSYNLPVERVFLVPNFAKKKKTKKKGQKQGEKEEQMPLTALRLIKGALKEGDTGAMQTPLLTAMFPPGLPQGSGPQPWRPEFRCGSRARQSPCVVATCHHSERANPELWFLQVESLFGAHRINSDENRYHLVVGSLDPESLSDVSDVIRRPPTESKYQYLKTLITTRFSDSADRQLARLLNELQLGDKKPSQLLRQMRSLAGDMGL